MTKEQRLHRRAHEEEQELLARDANVAAQQREEHRDACVGRGAAAGLAAIAVNRVSSRCARRRVSRDSAR